MKRVASAFGGTRNPLIVSWPGHMFEAEMDWLDADIGQSAWFEQDWNV